VDRFSAFGPTDTTPFPLLSQLLDQNYTKSQNFCRVPARAHAGAEDPPRASPIPRATIYRRTVPRAQHPCTAMPRPSLRSAACWGVALALLAAVTRAAPPAPAIDLLGDRSLAAWEFISATPTTLASVCTLSPEATLSIVGKPVGYLATKISHQNYQLHLEWRWPVDAAKNSNSGILLHIDSGPAGSTPWPICFQTQLKLGRAGDLLPMVTARFAEKLSSPPEAKTPQLDRTAVSSEKPPGEWNVCDLICRGDTIEIFVNGVLQNRVTKCLPSSGRLGLQLEGTPFEVREIRLTPLPPAISSSPQTPPHRSPGGKF
jgi:hypothetical protein